MAKVTPISEQFQHWLQDLKEGFWGDLCGQTQLAWKKFFQADSARQRDPYCGAGWHERREQTEPDYRNGYYERDFVTRFGTLRLRIARTRQKNFLPRGWEKFQRRAEEIAWVIREAFLRRAEHAPGRTGNRDADGGSGERADGVQAVAGPVTRQCGSFIRRG